MGSTTPPAGLATRPFSPGTETTLALDPQDGKGIALQVGLPGARPGPAVAEAKLPGEVNHLVGAREEWRTGVPTYERIRYPNAWPGVDVAYYGNQGRLEYDFEVAAGADPSRIALQFAGQEELRVAQTATSCSPSLAPTCASRRHSPTRRAAMGSASP